jgi:hypothetical protein
MRRPEVLASDDDQYLKVRISLYESLPLVELLGVEVLRREHDKYTAIQVIKPVMPFVIKGEVLVDEAVNLCVRAGASDWKCAKLVRDQNTVEKAFKAIKDLEKILDTIK